jgi:hypothetical protein
MRPLEKSSEKIQGVCDVCGLDIRHHLESPTLMKIHFAEDVRHGKRRWWYTCRHCYTALTRAKQKATKP